jgi:hypothetical protein
VTNPRDCAIKNLSIPWIVQKLNINERTHAWKRNVQLPHA